MKCLRFFLIALLASSAAQMPVQAQTVYRCGSSYSQTPCPGSTPLDVSDERSKAQKSQTDAAIRRDHQTAESMEKNRLKQEDSQARTIAAQSAGRDAGKATAPGEQPSPKNKTHADKKGRKSEYFTASSAGEKGKKNKPANAPVSKPAVAP